MRIGVVIADDGEFNPLLRYVLENGGTQCRRRIRRCVEFTVNGNDVIAVESGMGKVNAATTTAFLIAQDKCDVILNIGLSGAVSGLAREDFAAAESFIECDFDLSPIGYPLGKKPQTVWKYYADEKLLDIAREIGNIKVCPFGTGDFFLADKDIKHKYKETFGICEFDMETAAIASVCHECSIPLLSIRKISDTADDVGGETYREMNNREELDLTYILMQVIEKLGQKNKVF